MPQKRFLHVGCGPARKGPRTPGFTGNEWQEIRLDIDPMVAPDIIASITDLSGIEPATVDAVFSSHNIEHLYPHEAPIALMEFHRVLNDEGYLVITCPDIAAVASYITANGLDAVAYMSGMGPITPLDILYGHNASIRDGNVYMAHRTAFTRETLQKALSSGGYGSVLALSKPARFELWAIATKREQNKAELAALAALHIPGAEAIREQLLTG
jgi:SAM-dependent methyltransferase